MRVTTLSIGQVASLMQQAGFPSSAIPQGVGVATAESGLRSDAVSPTNHDGSIDRGLFQINSIHGKDPARLMDPLYNTQAAFEIWRSAGNSWRPWSTFNNGSAHIVQVNALSDLLDPFGVVGGLNNAVGGVSGVANGVGTVYKLGSTALGALTSASVWKRAALIYAGWMVLAFSLIVLIAGSGTAKTAIKSTAKVAAL